ncbi:MAG TPA: hypothetical protein ENJ31_11580, partial [Anaerolineae bacterium]|nr:hypothetical protein [Anaerolineae bacterium]
MAAPQPVSWEQVQSILDRQPTQQVPFAQYVVHIGAVQGGVINLAAPGQQAANRLHPLPQPPRVLPRRISGFVDREEEQRTLGQALARRQVVDLHGPDGLGKTALISRAMHSQLPGAFPDGMVYLSARHETRQDLLQALVKHFFAADDSLHVTDNDARRLMADKRALIAVDDVNHLEEGEAEDLTQIVPNCALLIAGREQQVWSGEDVPLGGLPREQAVALFERRWGPLGDRERPLAEAICRALGDAPLAIIKTASTARSRRVPLEQVWQEVQPPAAQPDPLGQAVSMMGRHLSAEERRLLGGLVAPGAATVGVGALPAITGLTPAQVNQALPSLQAMGLVQAHSPRYSVDEGLRPYIRRYGVDEGMRQRAADYYRQQAGRLRGEGKDPDEENVINALRHYYRRQQWPQVIEIARAIEPYLV